MSIPLTNGHGPQIGLLACAVDIPVPELLSGVYLLTDNEEVVYVGQTRDLMTRLMGHVKDGKQFDGVRFIALEDSLKDRTEAELICRLQPKYNGRSTWMGKQYYPQSSRDAAAERRSWTR
jgi:excinuclease UvrABC nuclease subunit